MTIMQEIAKAMQEVLTDDAEQAGRESCDFNQELAVLANGCFQPDQVCISSSTM